MPLLVLPATAADLPTSTQIEHDAYARSPFTPILFPGPFPPSAMSARSDEQIQQLEEDPTSQWMKIVDTSLDEFNDNSSTDGEGVMTDEQRKGIAFSKWNFYDRLPERKFGRSFGQGCNVEACETLFGELGEMKDRLFTGEGGYVYLHMLHVHPSHQRRGAAGLLLKWGQEEARRRGKKVYLESSPEGHGLYVKHGFRDIGCHKLDMTKWGGTGETATHEIWAMVWDEGETKQD